ncbi:hypothetical protein CALCODRAFT_181380 [Calocera cornea HHB12733]|uniref:Uncharacterized protein n=1 Tax=Calocera cornea HHB12733 TaxID=1353952 RepID=A0A165HRF5_9BASI|nr:hypothetical protein CALCODRAFT_181380 [Calocera cornea HHB12733]
MLVQSSFMEVSFPALALADNRCFVEGLAQMRNTQNLPAIYQQHLLLPLVHIPLGRGLGRFPQQPSLDVLVVSMILVEQLQCSLTEARSPSRVGESQLLATLLSGSHSQARHPSYRHQRRPQVILLLPTPRHWTRASELAVRASACRDDTNAELVKRAFLRPPVRITHSGGAKRPHGMPTNFWRRETPRTIGSWKQRVPIVSHRRPCQCVVHIAGAPDCRAYSPRRTVTI